MTPQETIKYYLHGYHQDFREPNAFDEDLFNRRYHYGRARVFLEVLEAVTRSAGISEDQIHKIQRHVVKERYESGADK